MAEFSLWLLGVPKNLRLDNTLCIEKIKRRPNVDIEPAGDRPWRVGAAAAIARNAR